MPIGEKEVRKELEERRKAKEGLEKRIVRFLQKNLLSGNSYCTIEKIEEDFKKAGFSLEETVVPFDETWLHAFLRKKPSIEVVCYKGRECYKYRYGWWARISSMFK